jgi:hypothetical protein
MAKGCRVAIIRMCHIFKKLCAKIVDPKIMEDLKNDVAMVLVLLEHELLPFFFDIMTHLLVHLMEELVICGLLHMRWMYFIECYLKTLKGYVCTTKSIHEGNMIEAMNLRRHWDFALNIYHIL